MRINSLDIKITVKKNWVWKIYKSIGFQVSITGEWVPWSAKVPQIEVETHKVAAPDVVVPTLDTVRHEALLYTWLAEHKPLGIFFFNKMIESYA